MKWQVGQQVVMAATSERGYRRGYKILEEREYVIEKVGRSYFTLADYHPTRFKFFFRKKSPWSLATVDELREESPTAQSPLRINILS